MRRETCELIDNSDFDAQIKRCLERIEDNIMPAFFEERLAQYQNMKINYEQVNLSLE